MAAGDGRYWARTSDLQSLTETIGSGRIGLLELIETISRVPDPLAQHRPE